MTLSPRRAALAICVASLFSISSADLAQAEEPRALEASTEKVRQKTDEGWAFHGEAWSAGILTQDFPVDATGVVNERSQWIDARIRLGGGYDFGSVEVEAEVDAINGTVFGDETDIGTVRGEDSFQRRRDQPDGLYAFAPRKALVRWRSPVGVLVGGLQTFRWGLGMVANDGAQASDFGAPAAGNIVARILFGTAPFAFVDGPKWLRDTEVFVAGDLVYRDEFAEIVEGDLAGGAALGLRWRRPKLELGLLGSFRAQTDRDDPNDPGGQARTLSAFVTDAYVDWKLASFGKSTLSIQSELAFILGNTDRLYLAETAEDGAAISSVGTVGRLVYEYDDWLNARLEAGLASGDNDPRDDVFRRFSFHSDYQVGLVLFDQVMPMLSGRSVDRINDPELSRNAPASSRMLINQGTVINARYIYPVVRVRIFEPLELRAAYLYAESDGALIDPYLSGTAGGGYNLGPDGQPAQRGALGQEALLGARADFDFEVLRLLAVLEGSVFFPAQALSSIGIETTYYGRIQLGVNW